MKKTTKIVLGFLSFWPLFYIVIFMLFMSTVVSQAQGQHGPPGWFPFFFALHMGTMLTTLGLAVFYVVNVFKNQSVPSDKKILWVVVLILGNMLASPFYWYLYIWNEPAPLKLPDEELEGGEIFCPKCGTKQDYNNYKCINCGFIVHPRCSSSIKYESVGSIIPYKNQKAILSYYLAVFSLIPGIGLILSVFAFVFGIKGRKYAIEHPEAKGTGHAWVGIVLGAFCFIGNVVGMVLITVSLNKV